MILIFKTEIQFSYFRLLIIMAHSSLIAKDDSCNPIKITLVFENVQIMSRDDDASDDKLILAGTRARAPAKNISNNTPHNLLWGGLRKLQK